MHVSKNQSCFHWIRPTSTKTSKLIGTSPDDIKNLSPRKLSKFETRHLGILSLDQLAALEMEQIQALPIPALLQMSLLRLPILIPCLRDAQINELLSEGRHGLVRTIWDSMTKEQRRQWPQPSPTLTPEELAAWARRRSKGHRALLLGIWLRDDPNLLAKVFPLLPSQQRYA